MDIPTHSRHVDLTTCDTEPIHAPDAIQPYGMLIRFREADLRILHISRNSGKYFALTAEELLGQPLSSVLPESTMGEIHEALGARDLDGENPVTIDMGPSRQWQGVLHRDGPIISFEIELPVPHETRDVFAMMRSITRDLDACTTLDALNATAAGAFKELFGYDQVLIYKFDEAGHGAVVGEAKNPHRPSYLGLHFPKSDVPAQSRQLKLVQPLGMVVDTSYEPCPVVGLPDEDHPDLSACLLRSVSPMCTGFYQNLGVRAFMNFAIVRDNRLWGYVAMWHFSPRHLPYLNREAGLSLSRLVGVYHDNIEQREAEAYRKRITDMVDALLEQLADAGDLARVLSETREPLHTLLNADGVAIVGMNDIALLGETPGYEATRAIADWLVARGTTSIFATRCLSQHMPGSEAYAAEASGILALPFSNPPRAFIIWFRRERIASVSWAGDPQKPVDLADAGNRLLPRTSFELWKAEQRNQSIPWRTSERQGAEQLRKGIFNALVQAEGTKIAEERRRLQHALDARNDLLATLSHELRTPMTAILGMSEMLLEDNKATDRTESLRTIHKSGNLLLSLMNTILDFSKIESGTVELREEPFSLKACLSEPVAALRRKAESKGIDLFLSVDETMPARVSGDGDRIKQIMMNLINNAVKFTDTGHVIAAARMRTQRVDTVTVTLSVTDTGIGIPPDDLEAIFQPFKQAKGNHPGRSEGSGLGLSICQRLVEAMGSKLSVTSEAGRGSTFAFDLDFPVVPRNATQQRGAGMEKPLGLKVLVADDNATNQRIAHVLLDRMGCQASFVGNGVEALAALDIDRFDAILLDWRMPEMDGPETARRIREKYGDRPDRPLVIGVSSFAFESEDEARSASGMDHFIFKPINRLDLRRLLATAADPSGA